MSVTPRGMSVQEAYREFRAGNFIVNRRYQRKLVWTTEEKQALIDSLLRDFPIPLILLAYTTNEQGKKSYEILDGMQRLDALFGFIEQRFAVKGRFFDVDQLARARQLRDEGVLAELPDDADLLAPEACSNFLDYTLAISEFPSVDEGAVNEIFSRINSYGRQLSDQEKRQAGVLSPFATLVRETAAELRGDVSKERLDLADMPSISVAMDNEEPRYGIDAGSTFWCKHGILRKNQLRDSEDEQMIADLAISVLEGRSFGFSGKAIDAYYKNLGDGVPTAEAENINSLLAAYGATTLKHEISSTISILRETIEPVDPSANAFRRIVHPTAKSNPVKTAFYAVFFAFFRLCVKQRKSPGSVSDVVGGLRGLHSHLSISAGAIKPESREKNIGIAIGLIQPFFVDAEPPVINHGIGSAIGFENALRRSRVETAAYECKQGLLGLGGDRQINDGLLDRIVKTVCGIANIGPTSEGALFLGVADDGEDASRVRELDGVEPKQVGSRFCVGVDRETALLGEDLEAYKRRIVDSISASELSEPLKSDILARIDCIAYRGLSVVCLWVPAQTQPSTVGDQLYSRAGSSTEIVEGFSGSQAISSRFSQR